MPIIKFEKRIRVAFIVQSEFLKVLDKMFQDLGSPLKYNLALSNSTTINDMTLQEVLDFPNISSESIESIRCESARSAPITAIIQLGDRMFPMFPIFMSLEGENAVTRTAAAQIEAQLRDAAPWPFWRIVLLWALEYVFLIAGIVLSWPIIISNDFSDVSWISFICIVLAFFVFFLRTCFPIGQFAIGAGKDRATKITKRRDYIFTIIVLVLGIAVPYVVEKL